MNAGISRHFDLQRLANFASANNAGQPPNERFKQLKIGSPASPDYQYITIIYRIILRLLREVFHDLIHHVRLVFSASCEIARARFESAIERISLPPESH
jgi:hypothetical protein